MRGFVSRERARLAERLLALHGLLHATAPAARRRHRQAVNDEYCALVLDVLDGWDAALLRLADTLAVSDGFARVPGRLRGVVARHIEAALDEYLGVRFRAQDELEQLDATWDSMMRLV